MQILYTCIYTCFLYLQLLSIANHVTILSTYPSTYLLPRSEQLDEVREQLIELDNTLTKGGTSVVHNRL